MHHGGYQRCVGLTLGKHLMKMLRQTGTTGGDHRNAHSLGDHGGQLNVVAVSGAICIDGIHHQFTRAALFAFQRPSQRISTRRGSTAINDDFEATGLFAVGLDSPHIHRQHNVLIAHGL